MSKKWIAPAVAVVFTFALAATAAAKDPKELGFNGKWVLEKNGVQASAPIADLRQDIKQKGSQINIQSTFAEPANGIAPLVYLGIMQSSITLSTDGQENTEQVGPYPFVSKSTLDGNKLVTEWHSSYKDDPVQGKWVRTLSDDGRHMTLEITETSTKGQEGHATLTFKRK